MRKSLNELEIEWNQAAQEMVKARHAYHEASAAKDRATQKHRDAKAAYMAEKDRQLGVEGEDDE